MTYLSNMNLSGYVLIYMNLFNAYIDVNVMSFAMDLQAMTVRYYRRCDEFCDEPTSDDCEVL